MSYAARLAAMSRGRVPSIATKPVGTEQQSLQEEVQHVGTRSPPPAPTTPSVERPHERAPAAPMHDASKPMRAVPPPPAAAAGPAPQTIERRTVIEAVEVQQPPALPAQPPPSPLRPSALPPQARWLAEDVAADDPLVAGADTDALRELMRSVRQWTSAPPTIIEQHEEATPAEAAAVAQPAPQPTSVSIGNVTITVEDAPPAASARGSRSTSTSSAGDRMTRSYIRGG